jgi:hypothetical protein
LLDKVNQILELYEQQGYCLTLRQLYYQLVARDIIPNSVKQYKALGNVVNKARLAGIIDWRMIEDRVRTPQSNGHWYSPQEIIQSDVDYYYRDHWPNQKHMLEVWCEKDAVSNIIQPVCSKWDVTFMANRGYSSQTAMYDAFNRVERAQDQGKKVTLIYLGDHDPSGIDMTRDIDDRMGLFINKMESKFGNVKRIALNMDQVIKYHPPENPAKITDSRYATYVSNYGKSSWELDALEPKVLAKLVECAITKHVDKKEFARVDQVIENHKDQLRIVADNWDHIQQLAADGEFD